MTWVITGVKWTLVVVLLAIGAFYGAEELRLRHAASTAPGTQTETLTFYYSTQLKNGREQVYYDQPQTEVCVRAVFPHGGRRPCWYARREPVRRVSELGTNGRPALRSTVVPALALA